MLKKTNKFLGSKNFLWILIGLFAFQSVWFALSIRHEVPPDETHHFQLINYYSERPLSAGPVISDQTTSFVLGDIERTPNYLYHYMLSFPLKIIEVFSNSMPEQVFALRLINVLFSVLSLYVIYRIYMLLGATRRIANCAIAATTFVGMFIWISASINYDNLGMLLFFGTIYYGLLFTKRLKLKYLLTTLLLAVTTVIVKITFSPVLLIFLLAILIVTFNQLRKKTWLNKAKKELVSDKFSVIAVSLLLILSTTLFLERVGGNIVNYGSITPRCNVLHSEEQCKENKIYRRDSVQKENFKQFEESGQKLQYSPLNFAGGWIDQMYDGVYFYFGHKNISPSGNTSNLAAIFLFALISLVILYRLSLPRLNTQQKILLITTLSYVVILYIFNLNSYLNSGAMFGFQGRYLLPVMPFVHLLIVAVVVKLLITMKEKNHKTSMIFFAAFIAIVVFQHLPLVTFYRGADATWFTERATSTNLTVQNFLDSTYAAQKGSLSFEKE